MTKQIKPSFRPYRYLMLFAIAILIFCLITPEGNTIGIPGSAKIVQLGSKGVTQLIVNRNNKPDSFYHPIYKFMNWKLDTLEIQNSSAKLNFYKDEYMSNKSPTKKTNLSVSLTSQGDAPVTYKFPCEIRGGNNGIRWDEVSFEEESTNNLKKCTARSDSNVRRTAQLTKSKGLSQDQSSVTEVSNDPVRRYCSAASEFSNAWGFSIESQERIRQFGSRWDIFSAGDPCKQAIRQCERESRKPGPSCQVASQGSISLDDSEVVLVLKCFGKASSPNLVIPLPAYSSKGNTRDIDTLAENLRTNARNDKATACHFDIYYPDAIVISPGISNSNQESIAEVKENEDQKLVVTATHGSIDVFDTTNQKEKTLQERERYVQFSEPTEPLIKIDDEERHEIIYQQPVYSLLDPEKLARTDQHYVKTASGETIKLENLTFKIDFCPARLPDLPCHDWRVLQDRGDLRNARDRIDRRYPKLGSAYVDESLALIQRKNPALGNLLQAEKERYLSRDKRQLTALDFDDLASISVSEREIDLGEYQRLLRMNNQGLVKYKSEFQDLKVEGYPSECELQGENSSICRKIAGQPFQGIQTEIKLTGAYGEEKAGHQRIPNIGAGLYQFLLGKPGEGTTLVDTSYFIQSNSSKPNHYVVVSFLTTPDRVDKYKGMFDEMALSFRFLQAKQ